MMLVNKFGLNQTLSGIIMALDNVLALVLLPVFGALSDKTKTKYGKRTPYIVIGTILAIVAFMGLTFCDNMQLNNVYSKADEGQFFEMVWEQSDQIKVSNKEYTEGQEKDYTLKDYISRLTKNKAYSELDSVEQQEVKDSFIALAGKYDKTYTFINGEYTITEKGVEGSKNIYSNIITPCKSAYAWNVTVQNPLPLVLFVVVLLLTLLSMATFRSPAVALMPDVTIKPLRSKANAIINLMGTAGGILVLVLGMLFGTGKVQNQTMSYTIFVLAVCAIMAMGLILFLLKVREVKWAKEMEDETISLTEQGLIKEEQKVEEQTGEKLSKSKTISLILILASVALWFTGYNAITTKYSLYASSILHADYNSTLIIAQAAAIIAYVPVGI
ncbi:MAG: MFS transporter, partial [Clostridia bacterium]|nr:MFS transporter [Clostridia bacterium]